MTAAGKPSPARWWGGGEACTAAACSEALFELSASTEYADVVTARAAWHPVQSRYCWHPASLPVMVKPLELASAEPLPISVERLESGDSLAGVPLGSSPRRSLKQQLSQHTSPYQALPVQGPLYHEPGQTPSYPVLEPDSPRGEVRMQAS